MSNLEREEIFSKDYLTIKDLGRLLGLTYQVAAKKMREIKFKTDRLGIQGKIHTEDYFDYFNITDRQRYVSEWKSKKENGDSVKSIQDYGANSNRDRAIEKQSLRQTRKESGE